MSQLNFGLSKAQSACIIDYTRTNLGTVRKLYFMAEPNSLSSINGKACQLCNLDITENLDGELNGSIEACDALDASGQQTVVQADISLRVPQKMFDQLLLTQDRSIGLEIHTSEFRTDSTQVGSRTIAGYSANVSWARFSLLQKANIEESMSSESLWLQRIFWALLVVSVIIITFH